MTEATPTREFEVANRYLGWGETVGGLWFLGLEEASQWTDENLADALASDSKGDEIAGFADEPDFAKLGATGRSIRSYTCKIAQPLSRSHATTTWQDYRDNRFWRKGCGLLQLNLYPLGKPTRAEWPPDFQRQFGFGPHDRDAYGAHVAETRFKRIAEVWEEAGRPPVVAFGKEGWPHVRRIFNLTSTAPLAEDTKLEAAPDQRVILAPFFTRWHMNTIRAGVISRTLQRWGVSLP
jgi:hypothetical protein